MKSVCPPLYAPQRRKFGAEPCTNIVREISAKGLLLRQVLATPAVVVVFCVVFVLRDVVDLPISFFVRLKCAS